MSSILFSSDAFTSRKARLDWVERANQLTHGAAAGLSLIAACALMAAAVPLGDVWLTTGCGVYGVSLVLVYAVSALSHSFRRGRWKHWFRTLDQVCIFFVMSGMFTPVGLTICRAWWPVLAAMWLLSIAGIATKLFVTGLRNVPVWFYVIVGWMPLLAMKPVVEAFPIAGLLWILAGGAFYTCGTYFLANEERAPIFHPIWHLMVIAGSTCHFIVMHQFLVPMLSQSAG